MTTIVDALPWNVLHPFVFKHPRTALGDGLKVRISSLQACNEMRLTNLPLDLPLVGDPRAPGLLLLDSNADKAEEEGESTALSLLARLALGEADTAAVVVVEVLDVVVVAAKE